MTIPQAETRAAARIHMTRGLATPDHAVACTGTGGTEHTARQPNGWRLRALAAAALVHPVALAVQYAANSAGLPRQDAKVYLAAVAADSGSMMASAIAYAIAMASLVAVGALASITLSLRAPVASTVSATLLTLGAVGGGAFVGLRLAALALTEDGAVVPGGVAAFTRLQQAIIDPVALLLLCALLGLVALAVAMHRSRREIGWWPAVATVAGFVLASGEFPNAVSVAGALLQGAALVPLARLALARRR